MFQHKLVVHVQKKEKRNKNYGQVFMMRVARMFEKQVKKHKHQWVKDTQV
ncbi:hypothetical protein ERO13_A13G075500v2 [Gossypium hirsutum]|uniref:Uncharacterized protein n=2 Tax=Gossypium TaxID=3633 RepID=A0A5D2MHT6_GOSTO|nr:hypothetical protein ERO13_A13G075500v2 [Gossypium hirsutum]TYG85816.1 hypothetical protein ES288_A13G085400v1 [Gossypium darwinii]TYH91007.1 hypothetical protein ES332_A13G087900v1 [Gossypium tomentosum]